MDQTLPANYFIRVLYSACSKRRTKESAFVILSRFYSYLCVMIPFCNFLSSLLLLLLYYYYYFYNFLFLMFFFSSGQVVSRLRSRLSFRPLCKLKLIKIEDFELIFPLCFAPNVPLHCFTKAFKPGSTPYSYFHENFNSVTFQIFQAKLYLHE